jgi:hypothetical protein
VAAYRLGDNGTGIGIGNGNGSGSGGNGTRFQEPVFDYRRPRLMASPPTT